MTLRARKIFTKTRASSYIYYRDNQLIPGIVKLPAFPVNGLAPPLLQHRKRPLIVHHALMAAQDAPARAASEVAARVVLFLPRLDCH